MAIVSELHLIGRVSDATKLCDLASPCDDSVLIVLLQCANIKPANASFKLSPFSYPSPIRSHSTSLFDQSKTLQHSFPVASNIDFIEELENERQHPLLLEPHLTRRSANCIGNAARFALREHKKWLRARLPMIGSPFTEEGSSDEDTSTTDALTTQKHNSELAMHVKAVQHPHVNFIERPMHPDEALSNHVLNKCLTGSVLARDPTDLLNILAPSTSNNRQISISMRRQHGLARRKIVRDFLLLPKAFKGEIHGLTSRAAICGDAHQDVLTFGEAYIDTSNGRVLEAVAEHSLAASQEYLRALFQIAYFEKESTKSRPWLLLEVGESFLSGLVCLADLLKDVEKTDRTACAILDTLYNARLQYANNRVYQDLLITAMGPYAESIIDWGLGRSVQRDLSNEFFGYRLGAQVTASEVLFRSGQQRQNSPKAKSDAIVPQVFEIDEALFVLRAGRSCRLLKQVLPGDRTSMPYENFDAQMQYTRDIAQEEGNGDVDLSSISSEQSLLSDSDIVNNREPSTTLQDVAVHASQNSNNACDTEPKTARGKLFVLPSFSSPSKCRESRSSLFSIQPGDSSEATTRVDNFTVLSKSRQIPVAISQYIKRILSPIRFSDDVVQNKLLRFFVNDLGVSEHFRNLRAHVLLGAGDFATILVEQIDAASQLSEEDEKYIERRAHAALTFYGTSGPGIRSNRDQVHLNRCFRMAINLYSEDLRAFANCLSLDPAKHKGPKKPSLWDTSVEVQYNVDYPLNVIFGNEALFMYSKIFKLRLRVLRAKNSLRSLFMTSRRTSALRQIPQTRVLSGGNIRSALWDFCWEAEYFVSIFGGFQTDQVLGSTWLAFEKSWEECKTIWELKYAHLQYLEDCIHRCLLETRHKSILGVMTEGFDIAVNIEKQLCTLLEDGTSVLGNSIDGFYDLLKSSSASLRRRVVFLKDVLQRLSDEGTHPHLNHLLALLGSKLR